MHNKSLVEICKHRRNLYTTNYHLMENYMPNKDTSVIYLKEEIPRGVDDKNNIYNNEKINSGTNKETNGNSPNNKRDHKKVKKNKSSTFETKKYSHFEKKIFKDLDYVDFLQNNKTISEKLYKKIILKKYLLRIVLPMMLFFLLFIAFIVEFFSGYGISNEIYFLLVTYLKESGWVKSLASRLRNTFLGGIFNKTVTTGSGKKSYLVKNFCNGLTYFLIFVILGIAFISGVVYYHKKVKKYEKIKFRKK
ncbi:Plasmodium exported protein (Pm-fam-a like), unknown function [Plasmodium malariae]|uniref:Fam-l protein n=1 Tax=Plasmodium malariae TaxID=5858 RepID=A0A1A8X6V0_PLAMA|nr:Plasmodium exported protein (Pm-fam-a like), unknown function [Plasmodium malariae]